MSVQGVPLEVKSSDEAGRVPAVKGASGNGGSIPKPTAAASFGYEVSAHTPGPWGAFSDDEGHTNIVAFTPRTASVFSLPGRHKDEPDVRLISAAPDLLKAAKRALSVLKAQGHGVAKDNVLGALVAAIGKAEGR